MTITIKSIADARFHNSKYSEYFSHPNKIRMTSDEQKLFLDTNFAVGYAGRDIYLVPKTTDNRKGLHNINLDMNHIEMRQYLWSLLHKDFSNCDNFTKVNEGFFSLKMFQAIANISKTKDITFWILCSDDRLNAELLVRFVNYLARF